MKNKCYLQIVFIIGSTFIFSDLTGQTGSNKIQSESPHAKDSLYIFYNRLLSNPYIKGLPDNYDAFWETLQHPDKNLTFYNALKANPNIKGTPDTYDDFTMKFLLPNIFEIYYSKRFDTNNVSIEGKQDIETTSNHDVKINEDRFLEQQRKKAQTKATLQIIRLFVDALGGSYGATIPNYNNSDNIYQQQNYDSYSIYPTYPGTYIRDYSGSGLIIERNNVYQTLPGTNIKDYSKPGYIINGNTISPTLPGTSIRDYSRSDYQIHKNPRP